MIPFSNMNKYPIFIPSKGRANNCKTANLLLKYSITNFKIIVEPQDYDAYAAVYSTDNLLQLPDNNRGLAFARKNCRASTNADFHWQMDDDVRKFKKRINGKNVECSPEEIFDEVEKYADEHTNIGILGLNHEMFAFGCSKPLSVNKQCSSVCLFRTNVKAEWRPFIIEDTDYSMQILTEGYCTVLFSFLLYSVPPSGSEAGGLTDNQHTKRQMYQQGLLDAWPGAFTIRYNEKYKRTQVAPSRIWKTFAQQPILRDSVNLDLFV